MWRHWPAVVSTNLSHGGSVGVTRINVLSNRYNIASEGGENSSFVPLCVFPYGISLADGMHTISHFFLRKGDHQSRPGLLYYSSILPEIAVQTFRFIQYVYIWFWHGFSIRLTDFLLLVYTKMSLDSLILLVVKHINFLRADANVRNLFRSATKEEIVSFNDCCAICREQMEEAKILPCGHVFHHGCLRYWLSQSYCCPICRSSLSKFDADRSLPARFPEAPGLIETDAAPDGTNGGTVDVHDESAEAERAILFSTRSWDLSFMQWSPSYQLELVWRRT